MKRPPDSESARPSTSPPPPGSSTRASDTASPCVSVCTLDASARLCVGCYRTIDEIAAWGMLDDDAKRAVNAQLAARRRAHEDSDAER